MSIIWGDMDNELMNKSLAVGGYVCLSTCGAAQWWHTLVQGRAEGLSLAFVGAYLTGLILLQAAFRLGRVGLAYEVGNGLGLCNALMMLGAWWWVGGAK